MKVLALDPGPEQSAFVGFDCEAGKIEEHGIFLNDALRAALNHLISLYDHLAIEQVRHYGTGMPAGASIFDTCVESGRFIQRWGGSWSWVTRHEVKIYLCGSKQAKNANVSQALIDRLGAPGVKANPGPTFGFRKDEWQALGVAVTYAARVEKDPAPEVPRGTAIATEPDPQGGGG